MKNTESILPLQKKEIYTNCYLTKYERQILFKKYVALGFDKEDADRRVRHCVKYLQDFRDKLRFQKVSDKEVNIKFKEEFAKLLEKDR